MDNKEKTKEYIKVMQAYVDGAEIDVKIKNGENWVDVGASPSWDWGTFDYRIKQVELVPGRWYSSKIFSCPVRFVAMDGDKYIFFKKSSVAHDYYGAIYLPSDIKEVPEPKK